MSARDDSQSDNETPLLWRLFIVGRSAVTGVFLAILFVINGFVITDQLQALFLVAGLQFAANGLYFWLWKRQDLTFLGYFCFCLEVALITLLIVAFGAEGPMFVLAYLWPIMIGGWMMGHRLVMPLTLLSSIAYAAVTMMQQRGMILIYDLPTTASGTPQSQVLLLPYLVFIALLVWALTIEVDNSRSRQRQHSQDLATLNAKLRSLLMAGQDFLQSHNPSHLRQTAALHAKTLTGAREAAVYAVEGDHLVLEQNVGMMPDFALQNAKHAIPQEWRSAQDGPLISILLDPLDTDQTGETPEPREFEGLLHIGLRSSRGLEGMLTLGPGQEMPFDRHENQMLQILGHQFGIAMENANLFAGLTHERNRLRGILANMAEGVCVVDHEGNIALANRAASDMLGLHHGDTAPDWLTAQSRDQDCDPAAHPLLDVGQRTVRLSSAKLERQDQPSSRIYVARDVTHEAQVERMKSDFVAYASHELRTPLATVKMLVGLLQMDLAPGTKQREYLDRVNIQVDRQHRLVNNLLDMTRLESGRYELTQESASPVQIMASVAQTCRPLAEQKGLRFEIDATLAPEAIITNASALEQVLTNLVGNAVKFTDQGSVVLTCHQDENAVILSVKDTGIGLSEQELDHIFDKFYTVRHPKKRGEGTGLGLAISGMIVERLGGQIRVESQPQEGSTFSVSLPLTPETEKEASGEAPCLQTPRL